MGYQRSKRHPELFRPSATKMWWAFIPNPSGGPKLRESTKHTDEQLAHRWFLERVSGPARPVEAEGKKGKQRTLKAALAVRLDWLIAGRKNNDATRKKLSAETIAFYLKKGKPLVNLLGPDTLLSDIGHEEIRRYIVKRAETVKANTIGKELTALSMAMRLARKDGVDCPVFKDIVPEDFQALYVAKERWLTEAEVDALVFSGVLLPHRAAVVAFIVSTSATYPSEVAPVRKTHLKGYSVHLLGTKRKARDRYLRVPTHARKYFDFAKKNLPADGFPKWSSIRRDLHVAAELLSMCPDCRASRLAWARHEKGIACGPTSFDCRVCKTTPRFEPLSPNDLRRTFAQWLVRSGVPHELTYPMMGHSSPKMLEQVYGKRDSTSVADLVELALKSAPKGARTSTG